MTNFLNILEEKLNENEEKLQILSFLFETKYILLCYIKISNNIYLSQVISDNYQDSIANIINNNPTLNCLKLFFKYV